MATELSLKLLVDPKSERVLFAEAGKDVVDFLFSLLSLPLGTVSKLLAGEGMVGSIGNLFNSIESLDETYLKDGRNKNSILNPTTGSVSCNFLLLDGPRTAAVKYYRCPFIVNHSGYQTCAYECTEFTGASGTCCPSCNKAMTVEIQLLDANSKEMAAYNGDGAGFVKGVVTYTLMDDLTVMPMSTISGITMMNRFINIRDVSSLEESLVKLGMKEGVQLLKASLQSKTVLTDVFLAKKKAATA